MRFKIGSSYTLGYGIGRVKIESPTADGKTFKAVRQSDGKSVHFGDPDMPTRQDNPDAKKNYCSRADGLAPRGFNPNTFSLIYWDCIPAKSASNAYDKEEMDFHENFDSNELDECDETKAVVNEVFKRDGRYFVSGKDGKGNLGKKEGYHDRDSALKRLREIEYFKQASSMKITCNLATSSISSNRTHYFIKRIPITVDDAVMNGVYYPKEENAKGMPTMAGKPITLSHPKEKGTLTTITGNGKAMSDFFAGGHVTKTYNQAGVWYADAEIKKSILEAQDDGKDYIDALNSKSDIGVSTGVVYMDNSISGFNKKGERYYTKAKSQRYDHLALLLNRIPAGGNDTVIRFNEADNEFNINDMISNEDGFIDRFVAKIANSLKSSVKSNPNDNLNEVDPMKEKMIAALNAANIATEGLSDDQLFDKYSYHLAVNSSKENDNQLTKEDIVEIAANAATKAIEKDRYLTANAEKESIVDQVIATNEAFSEGDRSELMSTPEIALNSLVVKKAAPLHSFTGHGTGKGEKQALSDYKFPV